MPKLSVHGISRRRQGIPSVRAIGVKEIVNVVDILVADRDRSIHLDGIDCTVGISKNMGNIGVHENPTIPRLRIVCQCSNQIRRSAAKAVPGNEKGT